MCAIGLLNGGDVCSTSSAAIVTCTCRRGEEQEKDK